MKPRIKSSHRKPLEKKPAAVTIKPEEQKAVLHVLDTYLLENLLDIPTTGEEDDDYGFVADVARRLKKALERGEQTVTSIPNERNFPKECC